MSVADGDQVEELRNVELARGGDHDAFVVLYRTHAPLAWRLALALTADGDLAAEAVAEAFARALVALPAGTARSATPFRVLLLATTRHTVLDARAIADATTPAPLVRTLPDPRPTPLADLVVDEAELARRRTAEVLHAFHRLPERWRTALWLSAVEGLDPAEVGAVVGVEPEAARELFVRSVAGLRTQWAKDRATAGDPDPVAPEQLHLQLQSALPLPLHLYLASEDRWSAGRRPALGALALTLPGGRPLPRWAERTLLASSAALIALGITAALAVDRDPDVQRRRDGTLAAPPTTAPREPQGYVDEDDDVDTGPADVGLAPATTVAAHREVRIVVLAPASAETPTTAAADGPATLAKRDVAPTTSTTAPPVLQVTAGLGPLLGLAIGDGCTGVELAGQAVGCPPATADEGVTLDLGGTLLDGG